MPNPAPFLKKLYPINNDWLLQLRSAFIIGLFIAIFLIVFQPFGLSQVHFENKTFILLGYGAVTFSILLFDNILLKMIFPSTFEEEHWYTWKQMLFRCWIIFSIGLGNAAYTVLFFDFGISSWELILRFQGITLAIGIIPILVFTIISQNRALKKNLNEAMRLNSETVTRQAGKNQTIKIVAENGKDQFSGKLSDLLFITSEGNYILIYHILNGSLDKTLLRNTLTNTEQQLSEIPVLFKTHRAYLVNLEKVKQVYGNSQGFRLQFEETENEVPVSRSYLPDFKKAWKNR